MRFGAQAVAPHDQEAVIPLRVSQARGHGRFNAGIPGREQCQTKSHLNFAGGILGSIAYGGDGGPFHHFGDGTFVALLSRVPDSDFVVALVLHSF